MHRAPSTTRLGGPLGFSAVLHASLLAAAIFVRPEKPRALPPVYKVNLVAAPAGPRAIGEVTPAPTPPTPTPAAVPPKRAVTNPRDMPSPVKPKPTRKPAAPATPTPETKSTPKDAPTTKAGGGPVGGAGTDVANVKSEGVEFPYPQYLNNIVRRDGSIGDFRFLTKSNSYAFDLEAQGAIESAAAAKAFGALPDGYVNDFLPVIFTFDPSLFR